jgi:hypothetical protein
MDCAGSSIALEVHPEEELAVANQDLILGLEIGLKVVKCRHQQSNCLEVINVNGGNDKVAILTLLDIYAVLDKHLCEPKLNHRLVELLVPAQATLLESVQPLDKLPDLVLGWVAGLLETWRLFHEDGHIEGAVEEHRLHAELADLKVVGGGNVSKYAN